jgi:glycosyltransferase involved in cell wall biosynthesis
MQQSAAVEQVAHVIAPAQTGGAETVVLALATAAADRCWVAALNQEGTSLALVDALRRRGVVVDEINCGRRRYFAEVRALERRLRARGARLVHTHVYHGDWVGYLAARRVGLPVVATVHGFTGGDLKNRLFQSADRWLLRRFDAVIAVSSPLYEFLAHSGVPRDRLHLVQSGLMRVEASATRAQARQALELPPDERVIGWVGRLSPEKGPDLFLQALAGEHLGAGAVVIGDGPEGERLGALARTLGLREPALTLLGYRPEAARLLPAFDVLALTSRTEGTPIVLLEAVAAGVPIVCFATGGIPDLLDRDCAWLVAPGDLNALRAALKNALADPEEATRRADRARTKLEDRLDSDRWIRRVWDVYRRVAPQC